MEGKALWSADETGRNGGPGNSCDRRRTSRLVDAFPYVLPYLLGFIVARTNEGRERIGDKVAGTRVAAPD
jgi:hypothetical protein